MPLTRSGSAKSTLSMIQRRATRYQKYLNLASVILIITSTVVIFNAIILLKFYFLSNLSFWSIYFYIAPVFMITLGVYKFIISLYGFGISGSENRGLLAFFAVLLSAAFVGQLASIFTAIEVRTTIVLAKYGGSHVVDALSLYNVDPYVTSAWDRMQQQLRCCGGTNFLTGYKDYRNTPLGDSYSVPDSCCHEQFDGCGRGMFNQPPEQIRNKIFVIGCLTALKERLDNDVVPIMEVYAGVGVIIALIELIAVVLTSAYIAQINRRRLREHNMWTAVRGDDVDHENAGRSLNQSIEHETMC